MRRLERIGNLESLSRLELVIFMDLVDACEVSGHNAKILRDGSEGISGANRGTATSIDSVRRKATRRSEKLRGCIEEAARIKKYARATRRISLVDSGSRVNAICSYREGFYRRLCLRHD